MNKFIKNNLNKTKLIFWFFVGIGIISLVFALQTNTVKTNSSNLAGAPYKQENTASPSAIPTNKPGAAKVTTPILTSETPKPSFAPTPTSNPQTTAPQTPTPNPVPSQVTYQINVSINGSTNYSVSVNEGANQCDVLSKSLEQGKISSLNMRFEPNYGSNAVYQINGVGNQNSVWWVFKVNGISPSQGCSYIKANNGDSVLWEYKGS